MKVNRNTLILNTDLNVHAQDVRDYFDFTDVNWTTQKSPAQLLYGYKLGSLTDVALLAAIQETLDHVDLWELCQEAKLLTVMEQMRQKSSFNSKRFNTPKYAVEDIDLVGVKLSATGQSKKLTAKRKVPFRVTAVLPNDRYVVEDLRKIKETRC